ncbi:hypothetical protein ACIQ7D_17765 [Streptomyces sp. NPDC096310]|uniref:hypothetical protein n=1 Tax=Streptomyces sp. NPDC096310 TaxID=3366082 RepID=UPI003828D32A
MLNPMVRWEPGVLVRYHGSLSDLHGLYEAHPCGCLRHADEPTSVNFQLATDDGTVVATCIRPASVTPEGPR